MSWRERLQQAVRDDGRTQAAIAEAAGVPGETLSRILTGATINPRVDTMAMIAHALGTSVGWLLGEPGYCLSADEIRALHAVRRFAEKVVGRRSR